MKGFSKFPTEDHHGYSNSTSLLQKSFKSQSRGFHPKGGEENAAYEHKVVHGFKKVGEIHGDKEGREVFLNNLDKMSSSSNGLPSTINAYTKENFQKGSLQFYNGTMG